MQLNSKFLAFIKFEKSAEIILPKNKEKGSITNRMHKNNVSKKMQRLKVNF